MEKHPPNRLIPSFTGQIYEETNNLQIHNILEYDKGFTQIFFKVVDHFIFSQYGLQKGLKLFRERGREATSKKMKQLHMRNCFLKNKKYKV